MHASSSIQGTKRLRLCCEAAAARCKAVLNTARPKLIDLSPFNAAAIVVVLAATFSVLNARFIRLPQTIGLLTMGAILSALVIGLSKVAPGLHVQHWARGFIDKLDFRRTLLDGMLSFLLFAGAFQIDFKHLRQGRWAILALAVVGTLLSTALVALGLKLLVDVMGYHLPMSWCFVFGALISPTDPVAVIAILKEACLPPAIQTTVASESLFNDGVGVVVFTIAFAAATGQSELTVAHAAKLFAVEAGGGLLFGAAVGGISFVAMRATTDYVAEVLVTLGAVMGGYAAAQALGVSGPVAMAVAGLIVGNQGRAYALSDDGQEYLVRFWQVIDEILNAVLFLLIGLEAIAVWQENRMLLVALAVIPIVLVARLLSVGAPLLLLRRIHNLGRSAFPILWWGGLRGGISIALALSIPNGPQQELILAATYVVVFFSVLVQGSTIGRLAKRVRRDDQQESGHARATG